MGRLGLGSVYTVVRDHKHGSRIRPDSELSEACVKPPFLRSRQPYTTGRFTRPGPLQMASKFTFINEAGVRVVINSFNNKVFKNRGVL